MFTDVNFDKFKRYIAPIMYVLIYSSFGVLYITTISKIYKTNNNHVSRLKKFNYFRPQVFFNLRTRQKSKFCNLLLTPNVLNKNAKFSKIKIA